MKINFKDRLKILTIGSIKLDEYSAALEEYLVNFFTKAKYLYSRTNIYGQLLQVTKDIANILFFYHDDAVTENNVLTAQKEISVRHFAEISGYQITRTIPSAGVIRIELKPTFFSKYGSPVYIRKYANLKCSENSLIYMVDMIEDQKIIDSSSSKLFLSCVEGTVKSAIFVADGSKLFTCSLSDAETIESTHMRVRVNNEEYKRVDSLLDMSYNEKSYFVRVGFLEQYQIIFGNGLNGNVLPNGASISVEYITCVGEFGNFNEHVYPTFEFISGIFDANGESIDIKEHSSIVKESGFLTGTNGDSIDSLRKVIGYNSRGNILVDSRSFESYLSKYSFLSRIRVWGTDANRRLNNIMILPNIEHQMTTMNDYFKIPEQSLSVSKEVKQNIIESIKNSELSYLTNEIIWVEPKFIKYVALIYIEPVADFSNNNDIYTQVKECLVHSFLNASFSRVFDSQDISKSSVIAKLQNIVGVDCRISVIFVSQPNEEAKINGFYYQSKWMINKFVETRIEVPFGSDPMLFLTDRNDIDCNKNEEVPILRAGFEMLSNTKERVMITEPVNLYIKKSNSWELIQ